MGGNPKARQGSNPVTKTVRGVTLVRLPLPTGVRRIYLLLLIIIYINNNNNDNIIIYTYYDY